jgi:hypothetical protein
MCTNMEILRDECLHSSLLVEIDAGFNTKYQKSEIAPANRSAIKY